MGPDGVSATMELSPVPLEEGIYGGEWTAEKPGRTWPRLSPGTSRKRSGTTC